MHDIPTIEELEELSPDQIHEYFDLELRSGVMSPHRFKQILNLLGDDIKLGTITHPDINNSQKNSYLHVLARFNNLNKEIVSLLLENGLDLEHKNKWNDTPLMSAIRCANIESIRIYLEFGANVLCTSYNKTTPLHMVTSFLKVAILDHITLLKKPITDDIQDHAEKCAALEERITRYKHITKLLLNAGADIHIKDGNNQTLLEILFKIFDSVVYMTHI